jgi:hypothetical protein
MHGFETSCSPSAAALGQFDLILGMPWLTDVQPTIDFATKDATAQLDNGDFFTFKADLKIPTEEQHIASLNAIEFARSVRRGVDLFLGWMQPQETSPVALNSLTTEFQGRSTLTSETPSPWSRTEGIPLTGEVLPVQSPTLETDAERDHRFTYALATLQFPRCASPADKLLIHKTLESYPDVLRGMPSGFIPPHRPGVDYTIPIMDQNATPPYLSTYRLSVTELHECHIQLTKLLARGFIEPSESPYGSPILFVRKKGGVLRFNVDFRALNKQTVKNRYAIPRAEELVDRLQGASVLSKIDLESGYWQIRVAETDVPKTAFMTRYGHYQFKVMPLGLTNAQVCHIPERHEQQLQTLPRRFRCHLLDDILIFSKDPALHAQHLEIVLGILRAHNYFARLHKCTFAEANV